VARIGRTVAWEALVCELSVVARMIQQQQAAPGAETQTTDQDPRL